MRIRVVAVPRGTPSFSLSSFAVRPERGEHGGATLRPRHPRDGHDERVDLVAALGGGGRVADDVEDALDPGDDDPLSEGIRPS